MKKLMIIMSFLTGYLLIGCSDNGINTNNNTDNNNNNNNTLPGAKLIGTWEEPFDTMPDAKFTTEGKKKYWLFDIDIVTGKIVHRDPKYYNFKKDSISGKNGVYVAAYYSVDSFFVIYKSPKVGKDWDTTANYYFTRNDSLWLQKIDTTKYYAPLKRLK